MSETIPVQFTVKILGRPYTIRFVEGFLADYMGRCNAAQAKIVIRSDMDAFAKRQTIMHEIIHAISEDCALRLEEYQVSAISNGLATIEELELRIPL